MKKLLLIIGILFCFVSTAWAADVTLAWDPLTDQTNGVMIYIGTSSGVYSNCHDAGVGVSQTTVINLVPGTTYYFAAKAYNPANCEYSGYSNEVSFTPQASCTITLPLPELPPIEAPANPPGNVNTQ